METSRTSSREVEVKLAFDSATLARTTLESNGARLVRDREFEDNLVYDDPRRTLTGSDRLLRLRRKGPVATMTFKAKTDPDTRHKVRIEYETRVDAPDATERLLEGLGYLVVYRYQKFRTVFAIGDVEAVLDETPIGCFVELEGTPGEIDAVARRLGFDESDYIRSTYRELHEAWAASRGAPVEDLVFPDRQR